MLATLPARLAAFAVKTIALDGKRDELRHTPKHLPFKRAAVATHFVGRTRGAS